MEHLEDNRQKVPEIFSWLLVLLFAYTAVNKFLDYEGTKAALYNQVFPIWMADILLIAVPGAELLLALMLCIPAYRKWGFLGSIILMGAFTGYVGLVITGLFDRIPCSCGGVLQAMSWPQHLLFNLFFLGISFIGYLIERNALARAQMGLFKAKNTKGPNGP
ncbi:MauE/DoxX family redox-associated membrane protein [Anditalea andensis]|uniref:Methylamine utilisation protein MauE domain-containing protein n=1 Tax=Anditalea andensis TaxID=1048983 RepID=A0A074KTQ1_9BACT|nr:MauE/DoxX family redox-associated membrane protein [Anditalea andensis]KEO71610.1 hypothetical protein EL17_23985 [Anditalea andensis]